MDAQLILTVIAVVLLAVLLVIQLLGKRKFDTSEIKDLLKRSADEQRESVGRQISNGATEQFERFGLIQKSVQETLSANREEVSRQLAEFQRQTEARLTAIQKAGIDSNDKISATVTAALGASRDEQNKQLRAFGEQVDSRLSSFQRTNAENIEKVNATLENKMKSLQESNEKRLEQIQGVVDEKLQKTLEERISKSFETVSRNLESVQQGLGEMKNLAADVGGLKKVLASPKLRGNLGEYQLEAILEQILSPSQYSIQKSVEDGDSKHVDCVIHLPGKDDGNVLELPIDSKFPMDVYLKLIDAQESGDGIKQAVSNFENAVMWQAKLISKKYINPPNTTNFAIMFLPTEGLYAETVKRVDLFYRIENEFNVTVVGPTSLFAYLRSLQMGFKTLAIEKRSSEVWNVLGAVKKEFMNFAGMLETAQKQINTAKGTIDTLVNTRTNQMTKALKKVETLPEGDVTEILGFETEDNKMLTLEEL